MSPAIPAPSTSGTSRQYEGLGLADLRRIWSGLLAIFRNTTSEVAAVSRGININVAMNSPSDGRKSLANHCIVKNSLPAVNRAISGIAAEIGRASCREGVWSSEDKVGT